MTTSLYMPSVVVEIAFNAGFGTPASSRVWTDVSDYVELTDQITINFGRQDERSVAEANTLSLTLDNRDGRFTPGRTSSPHYPNVKLYRPIRVKATPPGGSEVTRFVGYIDEWPVEWPGSDAYAKTTISASSRLARMGNAARLRSLVEEEFLYDSPSVYYPLGEPEGATSASDVSSNGGPSLNVIGSSAAAPVTFGIATGPPTDALTAATFAGGRRLHVAGVGVGSTGTVEFFFLRSGLPTQSEAVLGLGPQAIYVNTAGRLCFSDTTTWFTSTTSYADGATHHVALRMAPGGWSVLVDGVVLTTVAARTATVPVGASLFVADASSTLALRRLTGVVSHVSLNAAALSDARIADHATAGRTGFTGESTDARLKRYAKFAGILDTEVDASAGSTTMAHVDTTGLQVVELLRKVEATEGGVLFDDRDGDLALRSRNQRYTAAVAFTLDMGAQQVEADFTPSLGAMALVNDAAAANSTGTVTARATDDASILEYGAATASIETSSADDNEPMQAASWLVNAYAEPRTRVPRLTVDVLGQQGATPSPSTILAASIGTAFTVAGQPLQAASTSETYYAEGYTETIGPESWLVSFNVSPSTPTLTTFLLDSATRGVLGTNVLAY